MIEQVFKNYFAVSEWIPSHVGELVSVYKYIQHTSIINNFITNEAGQGFASAFEYESNISSSLKLRDGRGIYTLYVSRFYHIIS